MMIRIGRITQHLSGRTERTVQSFEMDSCIKRSLSCSGRQQSSHQSKLFIIIFTQFHMRWWDISLLFSITIKKPTLKFNSNLLKIFNKCEPIQPGWWRILTKTLTSINCFHFCTKVSLILHSSGVCQIVFTSLKKCLTRKISKSYNISAFCEHLLCRDFCFHFWHFLGFIS